MSAFAPLKAKSKPTLPQAKKVKPKAPRKPRSSFNGSSFRSLFDAPASLSDFGTPTAPGVFGVHAKLEISQPHDRLEREADAVADRVMRMPAAALRPVTSNQSTPKRNPLIQRRCAECEEELSKVVGTASAAKSPLRVSPFSEPVNKLETRLPPPPPIERNLALARGTGGQPMPAALKTFMEPRFGTDFGAVRLHHDPVADGLSRSLSAKAFTVGNDVFFRRGEFQPQTSSGQRLIAHELTHVVQQRQEPIGVRGYAEQDTKSESRPGCTNAPTPKLQKQEEDLVSGGPRVSNLAHDIVAGRLQNSGALVERLQGFSRDELTELLAQIDFLNSQRVSSDPNLDALIDAARDEVRSALAGRTVILKPLPPCTQSFSPPNSDTFASNSELNEIRTSQRVLRPGASSEGTLLVQTALRAFGCSQLNKDFLSAFGADGSYGSETTRAVREFQTAVGLSIDGTVGPNTLGALDNFVGTNQTLPEEPVPGSLSTFLPSARVRQRLTSEQKAELNEYFELVANGKVSQVDQAEINALLVQIEASTRASAEGRPLHPVADGALKQAGLGFAAVGVLLADNVSGIGVIDDVAIPPILLYAIGAAVVGGVAYALYLSQRPNQEQLDRANEAAEALVRDLLSKTRQATRRAKRPRPEPEPGPRPPPPLPDPRQPEPAQCTVVPNCPHLGGDSLHDSCADQVPPNIFPGCDVRVEGRNFDALNASNVLWEVKTSAWSDQSDFIKGIILSDLMATVSRDLLIASLCGFGYAVLLGDRGLEEALRREFSSLRIVVVPECRQ